MILNQKIINSINKHKKYSYHLKIKITKKSIPAYLILIYEKYICRLDYNMLK